MDYKIAIDVIQSLKGNTNVEYVENGDTGCDLAIEALEKQIPKKPVENYNWIDFDAYEKMFNAQWFCKSCDIAINENYEYCPHCGQKIDWED